MDNDEIYKLAEQDIEETNEFIEVLDTAEYDIDADFAFPPLGEPNEELKHQLLNGKELPDQHPITAITGLRDELDSIEALQVVFSNEKNQADYYLWEDENPLQEMRSGLFVTLCNDTSKIRICTEADDIFGATVDTAAFVGGQDDIARDYKYGLVVYSGIAIVQCELPVVAGDYVIPNNYGFAKKSLTGYGYKVFALEKVGDIIYAIISLGIPANIIHDLSNDVRVLGGRMDDAETNIAAAMNVANDAYNKSVEAGTASEDALKNATDALGKAEVSVGEMNKFLDETAPGISALAVQAKAVADAAAVSAEAIRGEAVATANKALADVNNAVKDLDATIEGINNSIDIASGKANKALEDLEDLSNEFDTAIEQVNTSIADIDGKADDIVSNFDDLRKDLEPLAEWSDGDGNSGVAGFVAAADENATTLAGLVEWKGDKDGGVVASLAGLSSSVNAHEATLNAVTKWKSDVENDVSSIAAIQQTANENKATLTELVEWKGDASGGVVASLASLSSSASAHEATLNTITKWKSDVESDVESITSIKQTADQNKSDISLISSWKSGVEGDVSSIASIKQTADANKATLDGLVEWKGDENGGVVKSLAGLSSSVSAHDAVLNAVADYKKENADGSTTEGLAGLVSQVTDNKADLSTLASYQHKDSDGNVISSGLAGLIEQVDANASSIKLLAGFDDDNVDNLAELAIQVEQNKSSINSLTQWKDTASQSITNVQQTASQNSASIQSLTNVDSELRNTMTQIEQKSDANGASIELIASSVDKYSVGEYSQAYGLTRDQAKDILKPGYIYIPTANYDKCCDDHADVATHCETFVGEDEVNEFTPGDYYVWGINGQGNADWIEHSIGTVWIGEYVPANSSGQYKYWYINSSSAPEGYEAYALYLWQGETWLKVNTLAGNVNNRITSMIRQTADKIAIEVANAQDGVASHQQWLDNNSANIQDVVSWKSDVAGDVSQIATIKQTANDASASVALVVEKKDGQDVINAASIVTAVNDSGSTVVIEADHLQLDGMVEFVNSSVEDAQKKAVADVKIEYATSDSNTNEPTSGWSPTAPEWQDDKYIWQKTTITKGDGTSSSAATCIQGANGSAGVSVISVGPQYALSNSNSTAPGADEWDEDFESLWEYAKDYDYIWHREKITYSDGSSTYTAARVDNAGSVVASWCADNDRTLINGGMIAANSITANKLDTNAITSLNYVANTTGSKLNLADGTFDSKDFKISSDGQIAATGGTIAGWTIAKKDTNSNTYSGGIYNDVSGYRVGIKTEGCGTGDYAFYVAQNPLDASTRNVIFGVQHDGKITATKGDIGGWTIAARPASGTSYSGGIYADHTIDGATYRVGMKLPTENESSPGGVSAFYVTKNPLNSSTRDNIFYVQNDGKLYAKDAEIEGKITATTGSFSRDITIEGVSLSEWIGADGNVKKINAESGTIGGWNIGTVRIKDTDGTFAYDGEALYSNEFLNDDGATINVALTPKSVYVYGRDIDEHGICESASWWQIINKARQ